MTILLLEDEPLVMNLLRAILAPKGTIVEATCEQTASTLGQTQQIDLLIADVTEPCFGIHVAFRLKAVHPNLRVILTSGFPPDLWDEQQCAELTELPSDSVRVLRKPFVPATVRQTMEALLSPLQAVRTSAARV